MHPWKIIIAILFIFSGLGAVATPAPTLAADVCACRNHSDCVNGSICVDYVCVKDGAPYTTCHPSAGNFCGCSSNQDCAEGQLCNTENNTCYTAGAAYPVPLSEPHCGTPQNTCQCASDADCVEGTYCQQSAGLCRVSGTNATYQGECGTQEVEPPAEQAWCKCSDYHDCNAGEVCHHSGDGPYADGDGYCLIQSTQMRPESCRAGTPNISPSEFNSNYSGNNCPCTSNNWCNDGETCSTLYGYCVNASTGQATPSHQCAALCSCNADDDCASGQQCISGPGGIERFCHYANGTIVPPRRCEPNTTDDSQSTAPSDACLCYSDDNCQNGETCSDGGYCVQTGNPSQYPRCTGGSGGVGDGRMRTFCSCSSTSDCGTGEMCSGGTCYEPFGDGWLKSEPPCTSAPIANACYCRGHSDCSQYGACQSGGDCQCDTSTNSCIFVNGPNDSEYAQCYSIHDDNTDPTQTGDGSSGTGDGTGNGSGSGDGHGDQSSSSGGNGSGGTESHGGSGGTIFDSGGICEAANSTCQQALLAYWDCSNAVCPTDYTPCDTGQQQCGAEHSAYWGCVGNVCGSASNPDYFDCPGGVCSTLGTAIPPFSAPPWQDQTTSATQFDPTVEGNPDQRTGHDETFDTDPNNYE